jgi:pimeloyl-ACP methyl ester carboxylesterase
MRDLRLRLSLPLMLAAALSLTLFARQPSGAADGGHLLTVDHYVPHTSTMPAISGEDVSLYVREKVLAGVARTFRSVAPTGKVVLFVHGATFPSTPGFDVPYKDYSWMAFLARAGFDVFALDLTSYGRSTRPAIMDDPCNLPPPQQAFLGISPCLPTYPYMVLNTNQSEWDEIDRVVDYLRALRKVDRVSLIGWSGGGPRLGGYAALHPEKVDKLILYAPYYDRSEPAPPDNPWLPGFPIRIAPEFAFLGAWDSQVRCENQFEPDIRNVVWAMNMADDPLGATWGPGVIRAVNFLPRWGWNASLAAQIGAPTLILVGEFDDLRALAGHLYEDLATARKVVVTVACSSHFIVYEWAHTIMFKLSRDWLLHQSIKGMSQGFVHVDAEGHIEAVSGRP